MENVKLSDLLSGVPHTLKTPYQRAIEEYEATQESLFAAEYYYGYSRFYGNTRGVEKLRPAEEGGQCPSES